MSQSIDELYARWKQTPDAAATLALCAALRGSGRTPIMQQVGEAAMKDHGASLPIMVAAARMYMEAQRLHDAQTALVAAGKADPRDALVYRWLGEVLLRRGDADRAEKVLERSLQLGAKDPDVQLWLERCKVFRPMQAKSGVRVVAAEVAKTLTLKAATPSMRAPPAVPTGPPPIPPTPAGAISRDAGPASIAGARAAPDPGIAGPERPQTPRSAGARAAPDPPIAGARAAPDPPIAGARAAPDPPIAGARSGPQTPRSLGPERPQTPDRWGPSGPRPPIAPGLPPPPQAVSATLASARVAARAPAIPPTTAPTVPLLTGAGTAPALGANAVVMPAAAAPANPTMVVAPAAPGKGAPAKPHVPGVGMATLQAAVAPPAPPEALMRPKMPSLDDELTAEFKSVKGVPPPKEAEMLLKLDARPRGELYFTTTA